MPQILSYDARLFFFAALTTAKTRATRKTTAATIMTIMKTENGQSPVKARGNDKSPHWEQTVLLPMMMVLVPSHGRHSVRLALDVPNSHSVHIVPLDTWPAEHGVHVVPVDISPGAQYWHTVNVLDEIWSPGHDAQPKRPP